MIICVTCGKETTNPKFCSRSCAAKFNNTGRIKSQSSKLKTSEKLKGRIGTSNPKGNIKYCKVSFCIVCGKMTRTSRKTCSDMCKRQFHSKWLQENRHKMGRGAPSYMEEAFKHWCDLNHLEYKTEIHFRNHKLNKSYYADFTFFDKKIIIELDGSQHNKTKEQDKIRDQYISKEYGFKIIRITYKEFQNKSKIPLLKSLLLAPPGGIEPHAMATQH